MAEPEEATVDWAGISIEVKFTKNWMNGAAHHLEMRAGEALSITCTGYKSHFLPSGMDVDLGEILEFLIGWLDEAAHSREWQDHLERKRQGDLFDL